MSIHIGAKPGQIADVVLLPGDPLRAKWAATTFLSDVECYTEVRGMLGFTGYWKGKRVSIQGTGMGIPSHLIYVHELLADYGARVLVRVGSCGSLQEDLHLRAVVVATTASSDSALNLSRFPGAVFAPSVDPGLFLRACGLAKESRVSFRAGGILSTDVFYGDDPEGWKKWSRFGVLAVEMETFGLYTEAALFGAKALSLLTVSDELYSGALLSSEERESSFADMMNLALATATEEETDK